MFNLDLNLNSDMLLVIIIHYFSGVFLSLDGDIIPNHGYVVISDIGSTASTALICNTNHPATVDNNRHSGGEWFAPDTTKVNRNFVPGFIRNRGPMEARLLRSTATDPRPPVEGIYHCEIEDDTDTEQTVYVGLYNSGRGAYCLSTTCYVQVQSAVLMPCVHWFQVKASTLQHPHVHWIVPPLCLLCIIILSEVKKQNDANTCSTTTTKMFI